MAEETDSKNKAKEADFNDWLGLQKKELKEGLEGFDDLNEEVKK